MQLNPNTGFFDVQPGEIITICVTAINMTAFVATFSDPTCTAWLKIERPSDVKECRKFVAPASGNCVVVITFDFQSPEPDTRYDISVSGSAGGSFNESVQPPPLKNRQYTFQVVV